MIICSALDFLSLQYHPPPPLTLAIPSSITLKYRRIFKFLMRLLRGAICFASGHVVLLTGSSIVQAVISQIHHACRLSGEFWRRGGEAIQRKLGQLRFQMAGFHSSFSSYVWDTAIRSSLGDFFDELVRVRDEEASPIKDIFTLVSRHEAVLDGIMTACLLRGPQKTMAIHLSSCLNSILTLGVVLNRVQHKCIEGVEATQQIDKVFSAFQSAMVDLVRFSPQKV